MKKVFIILITVVATILVAFLGWYFLLRNPNIPVGEAIRDILPFGSGDDISGPTTNDPRLTTGTGEQQVFDEFAVPTAKLFRLSNTPVAGAVVLNPRSTSSGQGSTSTTIVRYVDRATGHIYDVNLATLEKTKVTNQTLPKIYEAYFRPDGNAVLFRSLKNDSDVVENLSLALTPPTATVSTTSTSSGQASSPQASTLYSVSSTALRGDISSVAVGSGNTLFYALRDTSSIVSSAFNGTGVKNLFTSAFSNWRLTTSGNSLVIHTKASANVPGYAYTLNPSNGALTKIVGPLNGLVAISNAAGTRGLYSYAEGNRTRLFAQDLKSGAATEILPATLAEKCIWSIKKAGTLFCAVPTSGVGAGEPDNWYRGLTHFSDQIWHFDNDSDIAQLISEPKNDLDVDIDVSLLKLSPNEDYLIFINKTDLSLWALKLE